MSCRTRKALLPVLVAAFTAVSCVADDRHATGPESLPPAKNTQVSPERAALTQLTRVMAIAIGEEISRSELRQIMHDAPFKEHKLEFRSYLTPGRLANIAERSHKSALDIASMLDLIRPLEFYMPVAVHRATWEGDGNVIVASQLEDGEPIVAFDTQGREVMVSEAEAPTVPVLALVPVETRFDQPLDLGTWKNRDDKDGKAIGTMAPCGRGGVSCSVQSIPSPRMLDSCDPDCGSGYSYSYESGLYMATSYISDMKEPWIKGNPEIEVHVHGPVSAANSQYGEDLSCSGAEALPSRTFDQNDHDWSGYGTEDVLIYSATEVQAFNQQFPNGFHILFWEDDDTACVIKTDVNSTLNAIGTTFSMIGAAAVKIAAGSTPVAVLAFFLATGLSNHEWLQSNDDFVGDISVPPGSGYTYTIFIGQSNNGHVTFLWK